MLLQQYSRFMWTFLSHVSEQLGHLHHLLHLIPDHQHQFVKCCFDSSSQLCTYMYTTDASAKPLLTISTASKISIKGIIEDGVFLPGKNNCVLLMLIIESLAGWNHTLQLPIQVFWNIWLRQCFLSFKLSSHIPLIPSNWKVMKLEYQEKYWSQCW